MGVTFLLYIKARMAGRDEQPGATPEQHARRIAGLDEREQRYKTIHFISLFIFVLLGIVILVHLSNTFNPPTIT
jgi:hypothetical protein